MLEAAEVLSRVVTLGEQAREVLEGIEPDTLVSRARAAMTLVRRLALDVEEAGMSADLVGDCHDAANSLDLATAKLLVQAGNARVMALLDAKVGGR
jgi:hypothetical protein